MNAGGFTHNNLSFLTTGANNGFVAYDDPTKNAGGGGGAGKVAYQDLQTTAKAGDGSVVDGTVNYDLSKTTAGKIDRIQLDFTKDPPIARVQLRNGQVKQFELDPNTGLLLPAV